MPIITKVKTYADNDAIIYSDLNSNWDAIYNLLNGNLDNTNIVAGAAIDPTKIANTAATLIDAQTLTNKILIKPVLNGVQSVTTDTDGSTITFDMTSSNVHVVTLGGSRTLAVSNVSVGQFFAIELVQDGTGSKTVTWFSGIKWVQSTAPTLTTAASKKDTFIFRCTGAGAYDGYIGGLNIG